MLSIRLQSGRLFDERDQTGGTNVVILSDAAARVFFPGENSVGRTAVLDRLDRTVVGVVGSARQSSVEANPHPEVYLPMTQSPSRSGYLVVRTGGDPNDAVPAVRAAVASVLPQEPIRYVSTMDDLVASQTAEGRLNMVMFGLFGVMAYVVAQRTREIGVRMALGATKRQIVAMVLRNAAALVVAGLVVGGTAAWTLATTARRFLFGLESHDARVFVVSAVILLAAALVASVLPARRAASIDPTVALRSE